MGGLEKHKDVTGVCINHLAVNKQTDTNTSVAPTQVQNFLAIDAQELLFRKLTRLALLGGVNRPGITQYTFLFLVSTIKSL